MENENIDKIYFKLLFNNLDNILNIIIENKHFIFPSMNFEDEYYFIYNYLYSHINKNDNLLEIKEIFNYLFFNKDFFSVAITFFNYKKEEYFIEKYQLLKKFIDNLEIKTDIDFKKLPNNIFFDTNSNLIFKKCNSVWDFNIILDKKIKKYLEVVNIQNIIQEFSFSKFELKWYFLKISFKEIPLNWRQLKFMEFILKENKWEIKFNWNEAEKYILWDEWWKAWDQLLNILKKANILFKKEFNLDKFFSWKESDYIIINIKELISAN